MKRTFRPKVFETNSSMTHTLIIASKEDSDKWEKGELLWQSYRNKRFVTRKEADKIIADPDSYVDEEDFYTYEDFESDRGYYELEHDSGEFTSPSGDKIVWYLAVGRDG